MTQRLSAHKFLPHKNAAIGKSLESKFATELHRYGGAANDRGVIWLFFAYHDHQAIMKEVVSTKCAQKYC